MQNTDYKALLDKQKKFFATGATLPISFRIEQLKKLKSLVQKNEAAIAEALKKDLHKPPQDAILAEIIILTDEIDFIIKKLKSWAKPQKVPSPFPLFFPGRSEIHFEPYGTALIIAPWNYPFYLVMSPLAGAICAGNCAVVKPPESTPHTQELIYRLISENFPPEYIAVIKAGPEETDQLLKEKFDFIFFTGGTQIGKIIMEAAAKHLTPMILELGGKSPCIVDESADLDYTARRITWGKMINAGQTCIAPDYLYVHRSRKDALVNKIKNVITRFYGADAEQSESYARIVNKKHFARIVKLMQKGNILHGGKFDENKLYIEPTLVDGVNWNDPIMQEEIFGPVLPIITFDKIEEVVQAVNAQPKPLSLYLFTKNKSTENKILTKVSFGGGCINDCLMHFGNPHLPFGGVGSSGLGKYHGKESFEVFSNRKSIFKRFFSMDLSLAYPPYSSRSLRWIKRLLKL